MGNIGFILPESIQKNLSIEKHDCWQAYLCYKAVENTCNQTTFTDEGAKIQEEDCLQIIIHELFEKLTPYEKNFIAHYIQKRFPKKTSAKRARNR